jgi:hypothetical protein
VLLFPFPQLLLLQQLLLPLLLQQLPLPLLLQQQLPFPLLQQLLQQLLFHEEVLVPVGCCHATVAAGFDVLAGAVVAIAVPPMPTMANRPVTQAIAALAMILRMRTPPKSHSRPQALHDVTDIHVSVQGLWSLHGPAEYGGLAEYGHSPRSWRCRKMLK